MKLALVLYICKKNTPMNSRLHYLQLKIIRSKKAVFCTLILLLSLTSAFADDSLRLTQAFINLRLANENFDKIDKKRIGKIETYLEKELHGISDRNFIDANSTVYAIALSNLYLLKARILFKNKSEINRR